jgi:hypothetical protein
LGHRGGTPAEPSGHYVYQINLAMPDNKPVSGGICADMAHSRTYDPVNLNIEKKVYECVAGPLGMEAGQYVHSVKCCLEMHEADAYIREPKTFGIFMIVASGK